MPVERALTATVVSNYTGIFIINNNIDAFEFEIENQCKNYIRTYVERDDPRKRRFFFFIVRWTIGYYGFFFFTPRVLHARTNINRER